MTLKSPLTFEAIFQIKSESQKYVDETFDVLRSWGRHSSTKVKEAHRESASLGTKIFLVVSDRNPPTMNVVALHREY